MDGGIITVIVLIVVQIALFAFGYGKLTQKVKDICNRVTRLEQQQNSRLGD